MSIASISRAPSALGRAVTCVWLLALPPGSSLALESRPVPLPPPRPAMAQPAQVPLPIPRPAEPTQAAPAPPAPPAAPPTLADRPAAPHPGGSETPLASPTPPPVSPIAPPFAPPANASSPSTPDPFDAACSRLIADGKVAATRVDAVVGPGGCGIAFPVSLRTIMLPNGGTVTVQPPILLRCDLGEQLADWIRDDIAPLATARNEVLEAVNVTGYVCRSRNHVLGAALSEHGRGDAMDVVSFRLSGHDVGLKQNDAHPFWTSVKASACARFKTVLGPGSDGFHETNLHLDLEDRRNGSHYCHWDNP